MALIPLMVFFQAVTGAFVAGLHAGLIYNTFPLMDGHLVPTGMGIMEPWYLNLVENVTTVQFIHRLSALFLTLLIISLWIRVQCFNYAPAIKNSVNFLITMLIIQITLGVLTLLAHVPVALASLHQAGAVVLFVLSLYCLYKRTYSTITTL
jgi:cytochrome c oxidase assembly protein subunit 15